MSDYIESEFVIVPHPIACLICFIFNANIHHDVTLLPFPSSLPSSSFPVEREIECMLARQERERSSNPIHYRLASANSKKRWVTSTLYLSHNIVPSTFFVPSVTGELLSFLLSSILPFQLRLSIDERHPAYFVWPDNSSLSWHTYYLLQS